MGIYRYLCCIQWAITPGMRMYMICISVEEAPLANKLECYLNSNHMKYLGSSFILYHVIVWFTCTCICKHYNLPNNKHISSNFYFSTFVNNFYEYIVH